MGPQSDRINRAPKTIGRISQILLSIMLTFFTPRESAQVQCLREEEARGVPKGMGEADRVGFLEISI